ncbi:MAG: hypothetical protein F2814_06220 [Actinobacteria bacterium]|nr:hypothetical protein [Actinomycetota bacterium]
MISRETLSISGPHGLEVDIPFFEIDGSEDGPHLTVLAGVHGAEYSSIAAAKKFVREIDVTLVRGRITVVPIVNILGFWARTAFIVPADGKNLNRSFPGDSSGTFSEVLADRVFKKFIEDSDFLVDMHAGDIPESLTPFTVFEESIVEDKSLALAKAYGIKDIVRQKMSGMVVTGSTTAAAAAIGIPAVTVESGHNGILDPRAVEIHCLGITNLARSVGVLSGTPWPERPHQLYDGWDWLRSDREGWWSPLCETGAEVHAGQVVGTMSDLWGDVYAQVTAPNDGTILFQTSSPAVSAGGILVGLAIR